jgi:peptide/nickel transport system permease protein
MSRFLLRRLLLLPVILVALNMLGFTYASLALRIQQAQNPWGHREDAPLPILEAYLEYAQGILHFDFGSMPVGADTNVAEFVGAGIGPSLGLFGAAFLLSLLIGLPLGRSAVQVDPPRSRTWLTILSTVGLAMPGFYIATLLVSLVLIQTLGTESKPLLPVAGYGWDLHLVMPLIALSVRPTVQIARVTAGLLADELGKRYVTAERGFGYTWRRIVREKAQKNTLAALFLAISSAFRLSIAELILVEYLFSWPGIGRMLARTLVPPRTVGVGGLIDMNVYFLHPPLMAALLPIFGLLFYLADSIATAMARNVDPRLEASSQQEAVYG